jgi:hypothetical protein
VRRATFDGGRRLVSDGGGPKGRLGLWLLLRRRVDLTERKRRNLGQNLEKENLGCCIFGNSNQAFNSFQKLNFEQWIKNKI